MTNRDTTNPQDPHVDSTGSGGTGGQEQDQTVVASSGSGGTGAQEQDKTVVASSSDLRRDLELMSPTGNPANRSKAPTQNSLIGKWLDRRFEVLEVVGTGGMSVVYKARQDVVDRFVAIKTLKMQLADQPETVQRFQREIKSLCRLSHPHIVTVFDCIIDDDGQPYIAMDFLDGKSLDVLLRERRRLTPEECQPILVQICSALDHAHKHGIVHRDLKPSNIMLVGDELEFVKVVDFGLARLGQENQKITRSGEIWGSPPYMSPEQCSGQACDGRSDIYSLGVVMYEMVSGRDPFTSEQVVNTLLKHLNEPPPPFPPHLMIPQTWQYIIFKCLEKDPANRYQTMGVLKDVLNSIGKQQSVATEVRTVRAEVMPRSRTMDIDRRAPFMQTAAFKASVLALALGVAVFAFSKLPMHRATSELQPSPSVVEPTVSAPSNPGAAPSTPTASLADPVKPAASSEQPMKVETPKAVETSQAVESPVKSKPSPQSASAEKLRHKPPHPAHPIKLTVAHHEPGRHVAEEPTKGSSASKHAGSVWDRLKSDRSAEDN